jgi:hypothetical protein
MYSVIVTGANGEPVGEAADRRMILRQAAALAPAAEDDGEDDDDGDDGDDPAADRQCARRGLPPAPARRPDGRRRLDLGRAPQLLALLPARHRPEG